MPDDIQHTIYEFFTAYPSRTYDKRQIIMRPDEPLPGVFYIAEGRVSQYDITQSGGEVVVNIFKAGAFFPMSAALNQTSNIYFFEAGTRTKLHIAPPADAVRFLQDNPAVALDLLRRVYRGVDGILRRMTHLMGGDARHRLLFEILNTAYRFGERQADGSVHLTLKEGDLARQSGLARETVNRNIQALKAAGLLTVTHHGMTIKDIAQLEALLGREI